MRPVHRIVTSFFFLRFARPARAVRLALSALGVLVALAAAPACAPPPARAPNVLRPVPEARAAELIARTFRDSGVEPEADRYVKVGKEQRLRLEVAAVGHKFGVAYLTTDDWSKFGDALPQRARNDALVVALGEGSTRILLLHAGDYAEDDLAGEEHASTTIAAYRRLQRDVRDFLHRAQQQGWP